MPEVELGVFIFFLAVPIVGIAFMKGLKSWGWPGMAIGATVGIFGFIMMSALALFMFSEYDVIVSKEIPATTTVQTEYNSTGNLVGNTTIATPAYVEKNPIINSNHYEFGWIFFGLAFALGIIYFKVMSSP